MVVLFRFAAVLATPVTLTLAIFATTARADERYLSATEFRARGFVRQPQQALPPPHRLRPTRLPSNLAWPIDFRSPSQTIAQNYAQFQAYNGGPAYFHKGCDLLGKPGGAVRAPIDGILEGGYYGYEKRPDGSAVKWFKPWNGRPHDDPYFELALVTDDGHRFELHHVDSMRLPEQTVRWLEQGGVRVRAGTELGKILPWGMSYDHIHYNIVRPDGVYANPEFHTTSQGAPDRVPPTIHAVFAVEASRKARVLRPGENVGSDIRHFVVATTDSRGQADLVQAPLAVAIATLRNGRQQSSFAWDFRRVLLGPDRKWPDIRSVFERELVVGGRTWKTWSQYGRGIFLFRLPPPSQSGPFRISVVDNAGNAAQFGALMQD